MKAPNETPPPNRPAEPKTDWVDESLISPQLKKILLDMKRDHEKRMKLIDDLAKSREYFDTI